MAARALNPAINAVFSFTDAFIEWQHYDLRCRALSTYVHLDRFAGNGAGSFDIAHADVFVQCRTWRSTGECADLLIVLENGVTTTAYAAFDHLDADQLAFGAFLFDFEQGIAPDKITFIKLYGPAQVSLQRVGLLVKFMVIEAIPGL